jgi:hypothetical protein
MWIVAIAWIYVALMMAMAEATNPQGSILGAVITFLFYGVAPVSLVMYLLGTPGRRKARLAAEAREKNSPPQADSSALLDPDASNLAARDGVPAERKEP